MTLFYCDINGTFDITNSSTEEIDYFFKLVRQLSDDTINFSFISSNTPEDICDLITIIEPFLNEYNINLGISYGCNKIIKKERICSSRMHTKIEEILYDIEQNYKEVNSVYYAEDNRINNLIFTQYFKKTHPDINYQSFMPGSESNFEMNHVINSNTKGIKGLIQCLEKHLDNNKNYNNKL